MNKVFKAIERFLKKVLKALERIFKKIFDELGLLIVIFVIACFVFPPLLPGLLTFLGAPAWMISAASSFAAVISGWSVYMQLAAGLGVAALLSPDGVSEVIGVVREVAGEVAETAGEVVGGFTDGLVSSNTGMILLAIGAALLLAKLVGSGSRNRKEATSG